MCKFIIVAILATVFSGPIFAQSPAHQPPMVLAALTEFSSYNATKLQSLPSIPVQRFAVPNPGVDFMRARVEETYEIHGLGTDTVGLNGWIAVRHDPARIADGGTELRWGTAQMDTEFVGLELQGHSKLFGRVKVVLDKERASRGVVGYWPKDQVPEQARVLEQMLADASDLGGDPARLFRGGCAPSKEDGGSSGGSSGGAPGKGNVAAAGVASQGGGGSEGSGDGAAGSARAQLATAGGTQNATKPVAPSTALNPIQPLQSPIPAIPGGGLVVKPGNIKNLAACKCAANLFVRVFLPDLNLELTTEGPVYMHSVVQTIPPVGYTATVSLTPAKLMRRGVEMGVLRHAAVTFRELVYNVPLAPNDGHYYAMDTN